MSEHTANDCYVEADDQAEVRYVIGPGGDAVIQIFGRDEEADATARLIAASSDPGDEQEEALDAIYAAAGQPH